MTAQEFLKKYDIDTTFEDLYAIQKKTNKSANFTFKEGAISFDKKNYIEGLKYMLLAYMAKQTSPKNMKLELTNIFDDFGFMQFLRDYESAMQDEFKKSGSTRDRKPYEGVRNVALDTVKKQMLFFNDTLKNVWVKSIRRGAHLEAFREASLGAMNAEATTAINASKPNSKMNFINQAEDVSFEEHYRMVKESDDVNISTKEEAPDPALQMTFAVYTTMKEVIDRRTWGWRLNPFNWSRLREENKFMRDVKEKLIEKLGEVGLRQMELSERSVLGDFGEYLVLHTNQIINVEEFIEKAKKGEVDLNPIDREKHELEKLTNALDKDEIIENENKDFDVDLAQMDEDFEKLTSNFEREPVFDYFDAQDPNLYNPSTESADDIFLVEDSVEEAKEVTPAYKELAEASNSDNIILEGILEEKLKMDKGEVKENVHFANGEFNENAPKKAEPIEEINAPVHNKIIE